MKITLKRYSCVEDLICPYLRIKRREIAAGKIMGWDTDGNTTEFSIRDIVDVIRETGIWGYTDDTGCIHYWLEKATFPSVLEFFAHEIAHNTGTPRDDRTEEEFRADEYAKVAVMAYGFASQVHQKFPCQKT